MDPDIFKTGYNFEDDNCVDIHRYARWQQQALCIQTLVENADILSPQHTNEINNNSICNDRNTHGMEAQNDLSQMPTSPRSLVKNTSLVDARAMCNTQGMPNFNFYRFMPPDLRFNCTNNLNGFISPYAFASQSSAVSSPQSSSLLYYDDSLSDIDRKDGGKDVKACLICGDRATGLHYGITSCEGCKGFFKRSMCNKRVYKCTHQKNCVMSRKHRNRCQYCRLRMCLKMGMNRKAIRDDGMPGGRNKSIGPVKISDEEIERILSGKEFEEERERENQQYGGKSKNFQHPLVNTTPDYPYLSPNINRLDPCNILVPGSNSPATPNGIRGMSDANFQLGMPMGFNSMLRNVNTQSPYMQQYQRFPLRNNNHYSGFTPPAHQLALINQYAMSQNEENQIPTPESAVELSGAALVRRLMCAEDTNRLLNIVPEDVPREAQISKDQLFSILCKLGDEMLFRQIVWVKKLPFYGMLSKSDLAVLLATTWAELTILAAFCIHEDQLFDELVHVTARYTNEETIRFSSCEKNILKQLLALHAKISALNIDKEEYVIMKVICFLNGGGIKELQNPERVEELNKRCWHTCQRYIEHRAMERNAQRNNVSTEESSRFRDLILCLPDIHSIVARMHETDVTNLPILFKTILCTCKLGKDQSFRIPPNEGNVSSPPSPTSSPPTHDQPEISDSSSMPGLMTYRQLNRSVSSLHLGVGSLGPPSNSSMVSSSERNASPRSSHGNGRDSDSP